MRRPLWRTSHVLVMTAILLTGVLGDVVRAGPPDHSDGFEVLARDVYVTYGQALIHPQVDTASTEPLYNVAAIALGVTWGDWKAASGTSRAARHGAGTDVRVELQRLVPGGLYSVFHYTIGPDTAHPGCPGERMLPLDAFHTAGTNSFVADPAGSARYRGTVAGDPLAAAQFVIAVIYHADGQTYYPFPNRGEYLTQGPDCRSSFGHDAMRHVFIGHLAT